jgi:hypothetical protein
MLCGILWLQWLASNAAVDPIMHALQEHFQMRQQLCQEHCIYVSIIAMHQLDQVADGHHVLTGCLAVDQLTLQQLLQALHGQGWGSW